ncbi:sugar 3,4-ketoisomerase [Heliomicrobium gestii]|nr:FdtA/QdtA family cupin domain-containing protein [Heliomicrobium gestii]MBM7866625.1 dTDP-4-dehydrorhamnose 3,5-epimerase-like enzyme [Heliomicrobium gestii]
MTIHDCRLIELPKFTDQRGSLTAIENERQIPFSVKRIFYLYDISPGNNRGTHAHKELHQFLICLSGGFQVTVDDGHNQKIVTLGHPWQGLYIPPMIWATEHSFQPQSVCLVLASDYYDEKDYFRDYNEFLKAVRS